MAKSKLTPELIKQAGELAEIGLLDKDIYSLLHISHDAFYRYLKDNNEFNETIKEARIKGKQWHIENIKKAAAKGIWTASAWFLERKYPQEFSQKVDIKHEGTIKIKAKLTNGSGNGDTSD